MEHKCYTIRQNTLSVILHSFFYCWSCPTCFFDDVHCVYKPSYIFKYWIRAFTYYTMLLFYNLRSQKAIIGFPILPFTLLHIENHKSFITQSYQQYHVARPQGVAVHILLAAHTDYLTHWMSEISIKKNIQRYYKSKLVQKYNHTI